MRAPRVSIGMPVWNSNPGYFQAALDGVLAQDFQDFEIIMSDNGSHESARAMFEEAAKRDPRIRLHRHEKNRGGSWNMRFVLDQAQGELFMWAADDDLRSPQMLSHLVDALDRHPTCVTAASHVAIIDENGKRTRGQDMGTAHVGSASPARRLLNMLTTHSPNIDLYGLHRRQMIQELDFGIPNLWLDMHMTMDVLLHGPIARVEGELFSYRISAGLDESYARRLYQVFGDDARPTESPAQAKAGHEAYAGANYSETAFSLLSYLLRSRAKMSDVQRMECFAVLAAILTARGWFTRNELVRVVPALKRAIDERSIARSAQLAARLVLASPSFPFVAGAYKISQIFSQLQGARR